MYLFFDLTEGDRVIIHSNEGSEWQEAVFPYEAEDALLFAVTSVLSRQGKNLTDIVGVATRVGKGRFTATRIGVTVANTLAYALEIPVAAYADEQLEEVKKRLENTPIGLYVHAEYSAPASVGKKAV